MQVPRHLLATGGLWARWSNWGGAYQTVHGPQDGRLCTYQDPILQRLSVFTWFHSRFGTRPSSAGEKWWWVWGRVDLKGLGLNILSVLFQVQHSIQLEAVNKIKVDPRWGFETHGFSDKASTTRREWGRFVESFSTQVLIFPLTPTCLFCPACSADVKRIHLSFEEVFGLNSFVTWRDQALAGVLLRPFLSLWTSFVTCYKHYHGSQGLNMITINQDQHHNRSLTEKIFYPAHSISLVQFRILLVFATEVFDLGF